MKAAKILGGLLLFALLLFLFVVKFSVVESRFECNGKIIANGVEQATTVTVFLKLEEFRWWVSLWNDSRGSAVVEVPGQTISYFGHITKTGDLFGLWDYSFSESPRKFGGIFSTLSRTLGVKVDALGVFDGTCKDIQ